MEPSSERPRVIMIDDDQSVLRAARRVLRRHVPIAVTSEVDEALGQLKAGAADVALVDFAMPGTDGAAFVQLAKAVAPDVIYVFVTAHAHTAPVREQLETGQVSAVVAKPWTREELLELVHRLWDGGPGCASPNAP